jgi:nicotinate-nucleotide adenylyltransferase
MTAIAASRSREADLADFASRLKGARQVARHARIAVTGFEAAHGFVYTVDTAAYLRRRLPAVRFVWLMGADSFATLHRWRRWRRLMQLMPLAVLDRPGYRLAALAAPASHAFARWRIDESDAALLPGLQPPAWAFMTLPLSPLSSTDIRAKFASGKADSAREKA